MIQPMDEYREKISNETDITAPPIPETKKDLKTVHTYASDMADAIKQNQGSVVKIAIAEQKRREQETANKNPKTTQNTLYIIAGIAIVCIGCIFVIAVFLIQQPKTVPLQQTVLANPTLVRVDTHTTIPIDGLYRTDLENRIITESQKLQPIINSLTSFDLTTGTGAQISPITTQTLFFQAQWGAPDALIRSFDPEFTLGLHTYNGTAMFLLLKTNAYQTAFAGMLDWEHALFDDTYQLFGIDVSGANQNLFNQKFKDRVIVNQDTRALVDANNTPVLFYAFLGEQKNLLIITTKADTLKEVVDRLGTSSVIH